MATPSPRASAGLTDQGADVINLSLGDDSKSAHPEPAEDAAVQYALKKGAGTVVASAGNGGEKGDHISYPAAYPGAIAATAVDQNGTHASFSTRRWYATVSAPGVDVVIADPDDKYYEGWGTQAPPPRSSPARSRSSRRPTRRVRADQEAPGGHRPQRPSGGDDSRGFGFIDPAAAIEAAGRLKPERTHAVAYGKKYFRPRRHPGRQPAVRLGGPGGGRRGRAPAGRVGTPVARPQVLGAGRVGALSL